MPSTQQNASQDRAKAVSGGAWIAIAMAVMNVSTYGYQMVAARLLGPTSFGAFAAMMNLLMVVSVLALALQANAARRIAAEPRHVRDVEVGVTRVGRQAALGLFLLGVLATPLINYGLRLDSWPTALLVGITALPLTLMGYQAGVLQGERRWSALALVYLAAGVPRMFIGTALILWRPDTFWAFVGVMVGAWAPIIIGAIALRRPRAEEHASEQSHTAAALWRETLRNSMALLAYFALTNADILVARNAMVDHEAGLYAAGLILTKAVLFLPQFIVVLAFPSMGSEETRRDTLIRSLGAVLVISLLVAIAAKVLSPLAMIFVGGAEYAEIEGPLWRFALLGGVLAMIQLLVYGVIARQARRSIYVLWAALLALLVWGRSAQDFDDLLNRVLVLDLAVLVVLLLLTLWRLGPTNRRTGDAEEADASSPPASIG